MTNQREQIVVDRVELLPSWARILFLSPTPCWGGRGGGSVWCMLRRYHVGTISFSLLTVDWTGAGIFPRPRAVWPTGEVQVREGATFLLFSTRYAFPFELLPRSPLYPHGSPGSLPPFFIPVFSSFEMDECSFLSHSFHFIYIHSLFFPFSLLIYPYFSIIHEYTALPIHASRLTCCVSNPSIRKVKK